MWSWLLYRLLLTHKIWYWCALKAKLMCISVRTPELVYLWCKFTSYSPVTPSKNMHWGVFYGYIYNLYLVARIAPNLCVWKFYDLSHFCDLWLCLWFWNCQALHVLKSAVWKFLWQKFLCFLYNSRKYSTMKIWSHTVFTTVN